MICFQLLTKVLLKLCEKNIIETYWSEILFWCFCWGQLSGAIIFYFWCSAVKVQLFFNLRLILHVLMSSFLSLSCSVNTVCTPPQRKVNWVAIFCQKEKNLIPMLQEKDRSYCRLNLRPAYVSRVHMFMCRNLSIFWGFKRMHIILH